MKYIKGYLYTISYPKILFRAGYVEGYDILISGIPKFYILSYRSYILFRTNLSFLVYKMHFLLNTEINCEYALFLKLYELAIF
jgi:hypothetical protein